MKTTLEIPDAIFRRAKSVAAQRGIPLPELVTEAVKEKLDHNRGPSDQPWLTAFGKLRRLRKETDRINRGHPGELFLIVRGLDAKLVHHVTSA